MKTQQDTRVRMVALVNLVAMCDRISGMSHRFTVDKVSRSRVTVCYSNPSEYGSPQPVYAVYPCYPSGWHDDSDNPRIVLDALRFYGGRGQYGDLDAESQAFMQLTDCPVLWRRNDSDPWRSESEIMRDLASAARPIDESDYGSERQIAAQNRFYDAIMNRLSAEANESLDSYCLKATTDEGIDYALSLYAARNGKES